MNPVLRAAFETEMDQAMQEYAAGDFESCFKHLERAHILGQRNYGPHLRSHWWMLRAGSKVGDRREIAGQILRLVGSVGSLVGLVPLGNIGRAHVSAIRPMPIPEDLTVFFDSPRSRAPARRRFGVAALIFLILAALAGFAQLRQQAGIAIADDIWRSTLVVPILDIGETQSLSILPLVNWHAADGDFMTEAGVSYLVRTDQNTLLFDFGFNPKQKSPSPLEYNMQRLGVSLDEIDTLFLSHHHLDHAGGSRWTKQDSFSLGTQQIDLGGKRIFSPIPLRYPNVVVTTIDAPRSLGKGLASIGPIRRQLALGAIDEQALAINVAGRGIVLLVGCGHQTLERIVQRTQALFKEPIYGIVGDLHYPLPTGRLEILGINLQRRLASGSGLFSPLSREELESDFTLLRGLNLGIVALGGHDTSDEVIAEIKRRFGSNSRRVRVGEWIVIAE